MPLLGNLLETRQIVGGAAIPDPPLNVGGRILTPELAAELAERRRQYEALPETLEVGLGRSCSNISIGANTFNVVNAGAATNAGVIEMVNTMNYWPQWNAQYTNQYTNTTNTASCNRITYGWPFTNSASTTSINYTGMLAWHAINDRYERIKEAGDAAKNIQRYSRRKLSDTELLAALEQEREEADKRALASRMAEKRADDLLRLCLTPQQIEDLDKKKCFYVDVPSSSSRDASKKERYRIDVGSHGNVKQVDAKGSIIRSFCIQPAGVPAGDILLTQKLWLEASEETREEFWATANITTLMQEKSIPATVPRRERRRYAEAHGLLH